MMDAHNYEILALLESRVSSNRAKVIFKTLRFNTWEIVDGDGFSSGIWLAWKNHKITIEIKRKNF